MPRPTCARCGRAFERTSSRERYCPRHQPRGRASRSPTTQAQDAEYARERKAILAGSPPCHWCGAPNATTVDHVIPVARGGGHRGNLVPACAHCNYSRRDDPDWSPAPRPTPPG